jgi:DNA-binding MarR family transcriptional regulator
MLIGAPKEIKDNEFRVGLTPATVVELTHHGHGVIVEKSAGIGSGLMASAGIRSTQFSILAALSGDRAAVTIGDLASELVMDNSTLGQNLRPLEREGFVAITIGEDRRSRMASLTSAGVAKVKEAKVLWMGAQRAFEEGFGATSSEGMREYLRLFCDDAGRNELEKR